MKKVTNETWAGMVALGLGYMVYCDPCGRSAVVDPEKMPPQGEAIGVTFKCSSCGRPGHSIVYPKSTERMVPGRRVKA